MLAHSCQHLMNLMNVSLTFTLLLAPLCSPPALEKNSWLFNWKILHYVHQPVWFVCCLMMNWGSIQWVSQCWGELESGDNYRQVRHYWWHLSGYTSHLTHCSYTSIEWCSFNFFTVYGKEWKCIPITEDTIHQSIINSSMQNVLLWCNSWLICREWVEICSPFNVTHNYVGRFRCWKQLHPVCQPTDRIVFLAQPWCYATSYNCKKEIMLKQQKKQWKMKKQHMHMPRYSYTPQKGLRDLFAEGKKPGSFSEVEQSE